jgi:CelD/BcsL family acetyltransferase involved in cellulose biosynthesis
MTLYFSRNDAASDLSLRRYVASWTTAGALAEERAAWGELAETAVEPNPLYGANVLIAMERHLRGGRAIPVLVVRDQALNGALAGLAPLETRGWRNGFPGRAFSLFVNPYISLTVPLIRRDGAAAILAEMLRFLAREERGSLVFPYLSEKRDFAALLEEVVARDELALVRVDGWSRPAVEPESGASGEQYARAYVRKNRRANNDRRMRRLTDMGVVAFEETRVEGGRGREALIAFLELESAGWKGAAQTALICKDATRAFAADGLGGENGAPGVRIRSLTLDGKPIAMALDLESQGVGYAFKAAYDPAYARNAPGMTLDAHTAAHIGEAFEIKRLDSLAQEEIAQEGVWRQQEPIGRYVLDLSAQATEADALARRLRMVAAARKRAKHYVQSGREIVSAEAAKRVAMALAVIGVGLPLVSFLTRYAG